MTGPWGWVSYTGLETAIIAGDPVYYEVRSTTNIAVLCTPCPVPRIDKTSKLHLVGLPEIPGVSTGPVWTESKMITAEATRRSKILQCDSHRDGKSQIEDTRLTLHLCTLKLDPGENESISALAIALCTPHDDPDESFNVRG